MAHALLSTLVDINTSQEVKLGKIKKELVLRDQIEVAKFYKKTYGGVKFDTEAEKYTAQIDSAVTVLQQLYGA